MIRWNGANLQGLTDMNILPDIEFQELKNLATKPGKDQYLAYAELACRTRDDPSIWDQQAPFGSPLPRDPNATETEWAFLKCSQEWNDGRDPALKQEQDLRLDELECQLDQDPGSLEKEYKNLLVELG